MSSPSDNSTGQVRFGSEAALSLGIALHDTVNARLAQGDLTVLEAVAVVDCLSADLTARAGAALFRAMSEKIQGKQGPKIAVPRGPIPNGVLHPRRENGRGR
jgi:hypothetical protein